MCFSGGGRERTDAFGGFLGSSMSGIMFVVQSSAWLERWLQPLLSPLLVAWVCSLCCFCANSSGTACSPCSGTHHHPLLLLHSTWDKILCAAISLLTLLNKQMLLTQAVLDQPTFQASHGRLIWVISPGSPWGSLCNSDSSSSLMLCSATAMGSQNVGERTSCYYHVNIKDAVLPGATAWGWPHS